MLLSAVITLSLVFTAHAVEHHHKGYKHAPIPYQFSYGVKDQHYGPDFSRNEHSDGKTVKGSYSVQLPDGRKQIVDYVADHHNGFVAKISYKGKAQYPSKVGKPITFAPSHKYH